MKDAGLPLDRELTPEASLPADAVRRILARERIDTETLMLRLLPLTAERAAAPVSQFAVGAVVQALAQDGGPGALYLGANVEFAGVDLGCTVHAEQSAVNNAWLHGESGLQTIAINASPCGHCRQFLNELSNAGALQILVDQKDSHSIDSYANHSLAELLSAAFGPEHLGVTERLMQSLTRRLPIDAADDPLLQAAAAAASRSYAPYTGNFAGVALETSQGEIVCGRTAENAAFNPSLSAMASALAALLMQRTSDRIEIIDAVLVEAAAAVSQRSQSEALLRSVAGDRGPLRYVQTRHL